jgi:hypothetical protein
MVTNNAAARSWRFIILTPPKLGHHCLKTGINRLAPVIHSLEKHLPGSFAQTERVRQMGGQLSLRCAIGSLSGTRKGNLYVETRYFSVGESAESTEEAFLSNARVVRCDHRHRIKNWKIQMRNREYLPMVRKIIPDTGQ